MDEFGMEYHLQMFAELAVKDGVFKRKCLMGTYISFKKDTLKVMCCYR